MRVRKVVFLLTACIVFKTASLAAVAIPPFPPQETPSEQYKVFVNGTEVPVWTAFCDKPDLGSRYSFVTFEMSAPAEIQVRPADPFDKPVIRPDAWGLQPTVKDQTIAFTLDRPRKISIEPYGMKNVLLQIGRAHV